MPSLMAGSSSTFQHQLFAPAGCPIIPLISDTNYRELAQTPPAKGLDPQDGPHFRSSCKSSVSPRHPHTSSCPAINLGIPPHQPPPHCRFNDFLE